MEDMRAIATLVAAVDAQLQVTGLLLVSLVQKGLLTGAEALALVREGQARLNSKHNDPMMQIHIDDAYELVALQIEAAVPVQDMAGLHAPLNGSAASEPAEKTPRKLPRRTQIGPEYD
jgi:hypothetical protein